MVIYVNTHAILDARRARARIAAAQGGDKEASQVRAPDLVRLMIIRV
jgi:hypothetical protein